MHRLTEIELDFACHNLDRAQWFNASAEHLWQHELLPVAQQVLDEFDIAAEVKLDEICLQLPALCLPQDRYLLQHSFRQALRTQLWLLLPHATSNATRLQQQLSQTQRNALIAALKSADSAALTLHWPLYRRFSAELVAILRQLAASGDICTVLAFGLNSDMLAELVQLLAPAEQPFILQLMAQPQLFAITPARLSGATRQQLPAPALRQRQRHLWQLSLSFLLVERGSRFNRQSYLHYLLHRMAAHDNVSLPALVQHMLQTLTDSQRYFAGHSPLLLQLSELLQPLLAQYQHNQAGPAVVVPAYASQRRALAAAVLPQVQRHPGVVSDVQANKTLLQPVRRWQQWQNLLRQHRLTLAEKRQFNTLLQQLLQQNSSLWLDQLRLQLQQLSLLPSLVQYAQAELLQRLFQQLQPASVAAMTPYIRLLHWALAAISLPQPLQQQARWQPLLQSALQRQPLTLNVLLVQLQLWLQAQQGAVAGRKTLQQLSGQLQFYSGHIVNTADSQSARLCQQLQWQLAVTAPWTTPVQPLPPATPRAAAKPGSDTLWQQLLQLLVQALPASVQQQAQQLCQQVVAQYLPSLARSLPVLAPAMAPITTADRPLNAAGQTQNLSEPHPTQPQMSSAAAMPASAARLLSHALLTALAAALAPASQATFYQRLQTKLQQVTPGRARNLVLNQLQRLVSFSLPAQPQLRAQAAGSKQHSRAEPKSGQQYGPQQIQRQTRVQAANPAQPVGPANSSRYSQPQHTAGQEAEARSADAMQLVNNAGLVLAAPYLPMLWQRLGWFDARRFSQRQYGWQACALLQYMAQGETTEQLTADYWQQWRLAMLLCGLQPPCPEQIDIRLSSTQRELADSLLAGILAQWPKLANSSVDTLRQCFLQRSGALSRLGNGSGWQLQLDSGPYDMLLDGLPWSFSLICYPWMQGELYVHWRG
ncbi:MAG: hypothetical protein KKE30_15355 [Gammaproteobacteria bacterium]|nr:hypothetical protein [Gammaproteobacteria bacterium]MBU1554707.1 hypothetical protein [Gammaproteobacteria bacterium]MBU2071883.1 hypothetical protein [Gammaproteobacteria bacterium]MBU2181744.1 hypothetical protein [Gammaproteobacteria bacterium]MBU2206332.1 hypothetical protein [Gammaproteobacteria bacterium]